MSKYVIALVVFFLPSLNVFAQIDDNNENMRHALLAKSDSLFALGVDLYNAGKYQEAIPIFTESDKIDKAVLDSTSNRRDYSAVWLASCYYQLGDTLKAAETHVYYDIIPVDRRLTVKSDSLDAIGRIAYNNGDMENALPYFTQCAEIEKTVVGEEHIWYLNTLSSIDILYFNLARNNSDLGNYSEAIKLGTKELDICEKLYGKEHPDYALSLNNLAGYNSSLGNYSEAIRLGTEALNIYEKVYGKENEEYLYSLSMLFMMFFRAGKHAEATHIGQDYRDIAVKLRRTEDVEYWRFLSCMGLTYSLSNNLKEAVRWTEEAMKVIERVTGKMSLEYATSLNALGCYYLQYGNPSLALRLFNESMVINEQLKGNESVEYADILFYIANANRNMGNYSEAIRLCEEAIRIYERVGKENLNYPRALTALARANNGMGNYSEAIRLCEEAIGIYERVTGRENAVYADLLNAIAMANCTMGNYSESLGMLEEAMAIQERVTGKENVAYANLLNNTAITVGNMGNYSGAIRLCEEAIGIHERVEGKDRRYANMLSNIAAFHGMKSGSYTDRELEMLKEAVSICKRDSLYYHNYGSILSNLGSCFYSLGDTAMAVRYYEEALSMFVQRCGKGSIEGGNTFLHLLSILFDKGEYSNAISMGEQELSMMEKRYGKLHNIYAEIQQTMAACHGKLCNWMEMQAACYEVSAIRKMLIKNNFHYFTTNQRASYWQWHKTWFEDISHQYTYRCQTDSLVTNGYNGVLLSKGLLLNSDIEFSKLIQESGDSEVIAMYNDLRILRLQINKLIEIPITERFANVDSLERIAQAKEQALIERSEVYGDYTDNLVITWEHVQEKLTDKDIAVEFVSFPLNADSTMYIAYTLRKGWEYPQMIPLFEERQLKKIYSGEYYTTTDISELVWKPLEEVLQGVETVYFAPSGELYNIAIESVPDYATNGETIVSDSRAYYRLSSTRELALKKDKDVWKEAAVYGGLKYGMTAEGLTADSRNFNPNGKGGIAYANNELYDIADTLSTMRGGALAEQLPGTLIEAEAIDKSLEVSGVLSTLYTDSIGTEASFKNLNGKKTSIMHIGTHGFYWTEKEAKTYDYEFLLNDETTTSRYVEDKQLTRSGLLFAGANYVLSGNENQLPEGVDDGILTAKELTTIDLRGLDMVVLSACQTGLGEITGDGVFGLQRGFKKAGAQTIVMSLWKVNDEATRLFMTKFFEEIRLDKEGHPTNKHEAFLAAQRYLRDEYEIEQTRTINSNLTASQIRRLEREGKSVEAQTITEKVKPYAAPEYWAAFIMLDGIN